MRVAERMRREPIAVGPGESLGHAGHLLARHRLGAVPVVRRSALVGLLATADLDRAHPSAATTLTVGEIHGRLDRVRIDRVVRPAVTAVGRSTPLVDAIRLMRARRLAALPVAQGDRLVGLLTEDDLLEALAALLDEDPPPNRPRGGD
jgi:acetoin utilization protein AcuB